MADFISRDDALLHSEILEVYTKDYGNIDVVPVEYLAGIPVADVQPVKKSKWCPPLMGQGKCDTYCERCHGKIMRNSTGIFEETLFCPHCGARMDGDTNG